MNENQLKELDRTMSWLKARMILHPYKEDYIRFAMGEFAKKYNEIGATIDCSTCKHRSVSKYVEPCFMCDEIKEYNNYEPNE